MGLLVKMGQKQDLEERTSEMVCVRGGQGNLWQGVDEGVQAAANLKSWQLGISEGWESNEGWSCLAELGA